MQLTRHDHYLFGSIVELKNDIVFQANRREIDLALVREHYANANIPAHNDFLGLVGSYELSFASGIPETTLNYATMLKPFDNYIWALIAISFLSVMLTFLVIDKVSTLWMRNSTKNSFYQSIISIFYTE